MRSKRLSAFAATFLSVAAFAAFNPPQYTNTYTSGGVTYAQFGGVKSSNYVATAVANLWMASNYVDAVASEFEDGTRTVLSAQNAGDASTAGTSYYLAGESSEDQYNADDLMRASTNAALSVSGTLEWRLTNGYLKVASAESADTATSADTAQNAANVAWDANGNYMSGSEIYARVMEDVPRPGNYSAVSNAAMNARSMTDLGVRGAPHGEGSWFVVDGYVLAKSPLGEFWSVENLYQIVSVESEYQLNEWAGSGWAGIGTFVLNESFSSVLEGHTIVGYTNVLAQVSQIPDVSGYTTHQQATNAAIAVADAKISTNNEAFVSAVLAVPIAGADAGDLAEIAEYGSYGTVGAAVLALIAGLAALKRRVASAETALAQKANASDLPYSLVAPGEWSFSPSSYDGREFSIVEQAGSEVGSASYLLFLGEEQVAGIIDGEPNKLGLVFEAQLVGDPDNPFTVTATRASLPGHLLDRAGNRVVVSGDTTLTLPAAVPGYLRDFLVRLEIGGSTVPTITFSPDGNESVTYETDGDEFPVPDEAGTWLYSFTESCVAHKFAVALKKVNTVAQGGA